LNENNEYPSFSDRNPLKNKGFCLENSSRNKVISPKSSSYYYEKSNSSLNNLKTIESNFSNQNLSRKPTFFSESDNKVKRDLSLSNNQFIVMNKEKTKKIEKFLNVNSNDNGLFNKSKYDDFIDNLSKPRIIKHYEKMDNLLKVKEIKHYDKLTKLIDERKNLITSDLNTRSNNNNNYNRNRVHTNKILRDIENFSNSLTLSQSERCVNRPTTTNHLGLGFNTKKYLIASPTNRNHLFNNGYYKTFKNNNYQSENILSEFKFFNQTNNEKFSALSQQFTKLNK